jgi:hypothetical protein
MNVRPAPILKPRDRDAIIASLRAGVVPRIGLQHIQVGRHKEVEALIKDVDRICEGGSIVRFIIGDYGAGKTFFLFLIRQIALHKKLVACQADSSPDRRIHATGGQARMLYAELVKGLSTRTTPDGGALSSILESFLQTCLEESQTTGRPLKTSIHERLRDIREMVAGHDFAVAVAAYAEGYEDGNSHLQDCALRWLRGEYTTRTQARADLGVRTIIDDGSFYDALRLLARFVRIAGYGGLLVCLDELVNLYKLQNSQARRQNYEQILRILNDVLQGTTEGIGFIMSGTPEFLQDSRRGLYSYEALQSRLAANVFARPGLVDHSGPVITLPNLTREELYHLLERMRDVFASGITENYLVPDEALHAFIQHCHANIGDAYFRTPRNSVKAFVGMLALLEENPALTWRDLIGSTQIEVDYGATTDVPTEGGEDELTMLRL